MQEHEHISPYFHRIYLYLWIYVLLLFLTGMCLAGPMEVLRGLKTIVLTEDALITDYALIAGPGAALVNSALVTGISLLLLQWSHQPVNGVTLVVIGLMSGFSLFGKNFVNIWPILTGTWLYGISRREPIGKHTVTGLMSTALSPIVSYFVLDNGWGSLPSGILIGMLIGFVMPSLSAYTYKVQNGMNLYNIGFAGGLVAFIVVAIISSMGATPVTRYVWATDCDWVFGLLIGGICVVLIFAGFFLCKKPVWAVWAGYRRLLLTSGRAPSDYLRMFGPAPVMVNMGVNGLLVMALILAIGGDLNGPTAGGILTVMGFSAFGKHAANITPVIAGVILGSMVMHWSLSDSAVQLTCLFCTVLAPIAGYFGWPYGVLAGFLHSAVVLQTGSPVAGMNLYNNGFSGGLVAIVLYGVIIAVIQHRKPEIRDEDYLDPIIHDEPVEPPPKHTMTEEKE